MIEAMSRESVERRLVADSISLTNIESSSSAAQYEGLSDSNPHRSRWSENCEYSIFVNSPQTAYLGSV